MSLTALPLLDSALISARFSPRRASLVSFSIALVDRTSCCDWLREPRKALWVEIDDANEAEWVWTVDWSELRSESERFVKSKIVLRSDSSSARARGIELNWRRRGQSGGKS